jgi:peptide methionine sulfoxide reductase MsrB
MAGKKRQKQEPKVCDHCGKLFKSGAGVAMHMKWVNGKTHPTKGKKLTGLALEKQKQYIKIAQAKSPTGKNAGKRVELNCLACNKKFFVVPSQIDRRKYCSKICSYKNINVINNINYSQGYKRVTLNCKNCKKQFQVAPSQANKRKCCSRYCANQIPMSQKQKDLISLNQKIRFKENPESNPFYGRTPTNYNGWGHGGYCEELGFHVRSTWERDYLIALKEAAIVFTYEPKRFDLGNGRGTYLPDIQITETDFIEITGWDKPGKAEKRKLFCEVYPDYTLHVINKAPSDQTKQKLIDYCKEVVGE